MCRHLTPARAALASAPIPMDQPAGVGSLQGSCCPCSPWQPWQCHGAFLAGATVSGEPGPQVPNNSLWDSQALRASPGAVAWGAARPVWCRGTRGVLCRPLWLLACLRARLPGSLDFGAGTLRETEQGELAPQVHFLFGKVGAGFTWQQLRWGSRQHTR